MRTSAPTTLGTLPVRRGAHHQGGHPVGGAGARGGPTGEPRSPPPPARTASASAGPAPAPAPGQLRVDQLRPGAGQAAARPPPGPLTGERHRRRHRLPGMPQRQLRRLADRPVQQHHPAQPVAQRPGQVYRHRATERVPHQAAAPDRHPAARRRAQHIADVLLDGPRRLHQRQAVTAQVRRQEAEPRGYQMGNRPPCPLTPCSASTGWPPVPRTCAGAAGYHRAGQ